MAPADDPRTGARKGKPLRFVNGHQARPNKPQYVLNPDTGCWIWNWGKNKGGYGRLGQKYAHRVYFERHKGTIPPGHQIHHLCRNKLCVNPDHLEVLSVERHGWREAGKLTEMQVAKIRVLLGESVTCREIAAQYGVSEGTIRDIKRGKAWRENLRCPSCGHEFDPIDGLK